MEQVARFKIEGSVIEETLCSEMTGLDAYVHVDSDEPPERIQKLINMGQQSCYTHQALINPVPVFVHATLNGQELRIEDP